MNKDWSSLKTRAQELANGAYDYGLGLEILELIAENELLRGIKQLCPLHQKSYCDMCAWPRAEQSEVSRLKAENERLRDALKLLRDHTSVSLNQIEMIDAAMAKEVRS